MPGGRHLPAAVVAIVSLGIGAATSPATVVVPWAISAGGGGAATVGRSVSTLTDGSSIVAGYFNGTVNFGSTTFTSSGGRDAYVAKVGPDGSFLWATQAGGTGNDYAYSVSTLADGSAIVGGSFSGTVTFGSTSLTSAGGEDVFVAKVNPDGTFAWATRGGGSGYAGVIALSTLPDGSAVVAGGFSGAATFGSTTLTSLGSTDVLIAMVSASGSFSWATSAGGAGADFAEGLDAFADGSAVVVGNFGGSATFGTTTLTSAGSNDAFVAKLDPMGSFAWATQAGGTGNDAAFGVSTNVDGSSVVAGWFAGTATFGTTTFTSAGLDDAFVAKLDPMGSFAWATQAGGTGNDYALGVSTDVNGSSVVAGGFSGTATFGATTFTSAGGRDAFTAELDPMGSFAWATQAGGTGNDYAYSVSALPDGSSVVAGPFAGTATFGATTLVAAGSSDIFAAKVQPLTAPGAPTNVTVTPGNTEAVVSWNAPVVTGGSAIISYTATASPGGATCTTAGTSCTITGLANGTTYTVTVTATNATGTSRPSAASEAVTLAVIPAAPASAATAATAPTSTTLSPVVLPSRTRLRSGQTLRVGIRARNTGSVTASSTTSCLRLPSNFSIVRRNGALRSGRTLCFRVGDIAAGRSVTKVVTLRAVGTRTVTRRITGTTRSASADPARTTTRSAAIRISPRPARARVTG